MLEVNAIDAYYDETQVLFDVSLSIETGEVVSLVGRNGMGKTTTVRSILNLAEVRSGTIEYEGEDITGAPTEKIAQRGIGYVPEERDIFSDLTVVENLRMAGVDIGGAETEKRIEEVFERFPKLRELEDSKGGHLSGGEQQMLTIGRALVGDNDLLLIDEPTEGLAPLIAEDVEKAVADLKGEKTILLIEQSTEFVYNLSDRIYGIVNGEIVYEGDPEDARETGDVKDILTVS
ncbi:ABC transporter ATP-binding protein [Haloarchaeobius sp. HRN-SO-5]|uniref:ABC transporter ATP-binding protein n=1 Tax=Haloarchaeobius sp. HRN-SO-5 TaxID=3446118 RepID=UPI003EBF0BFC